MIFSFYFLSCLVQCAPAPGLFGIFEKFGNLFAEGAIGEAAGDAINSPTTLSQGSIKRTQEIGNSLAPSKADVVATKPPSNSKSTISEQVRAALMQFV